MLTSRCRFCHQAVVQVDEVGGYWKHQNTNMYCTTTNVAEPEEASRTFGDRLGELVVEYSECLPRVDKPRILNELEDTTDHAYNQAAIEVAFILTEFSARRS